MVKASPGVLAAVAAAMWCSGDLGPLPSPRVEAAQSAPIEAGARLKAPPEVVAWLADARRVARSSHRTELFLDLRDADTLGPIVRRVHDRHASSPLTPNELHTEVSRWGAACGQVAGSLFSPCHWGPAKEHNLRYGYSMFIPLEGGGWIEDTCFEHIERLITEPEPANGLTIEAALALGHFLD